MNECRRQVNAGKFNNQVNTYEHEEFTDQVQVFNTAKHATKKGNSFDSRLSETGYGSGVALIWVEFALSLHNATDRKNHLTGVSFVACADGGCE